MANKFSIVLPAHPKDPLIWKEQQIQAEEAIEKGMSIFWELDLGIASSKTDFNDPSTFLTHCIALQAFDQTIWKNFFNKTVGISIYKGPFDFSERIMNPSKEHFEEWLADHNLALSELEGHFYKVYCANIFGEYLHRLASCLPDNLPVFCSIDATNAESRAALAHILSKDRFEHIHLSIKGDRLPSMNSIPVSVGVLLPNDEGISLEILAELDRVFDQFDERNTPFRIISETFLTEQWNGIDILIVISSSLNSIGKRKLQGFCAAGGTVYYIGSPIGLAQELPFSSNFISF